MKQLKLTLVVFLVSFLATSQTKEQLNALDIYFQKSLTEWHIPGMAIAITNKDSIIFSKGYGYANIEKQTKVDGNTLFAVASNSKAFTASSLAQIVDEGKLHWNDKVINFLPYFKMYNDYVTDNFTISDLLSHHSGLVTFSGDLLWYGTTKTPEEIINDQQYLKPKYPFRTTFGYSNIAFLTAGEVLQKITGQSWANYVTTHFITPLKMTRTLTSTKQLATTTNIATPYFYKNGSYHQLAWVNWDNIAPAGGIITSVNDFSKWLQLNLHEGTYEGITYFTKKSFDELTTPHTNFKVSDNDHKTHFKAYGMGWNLEDFQGSKVISHSGGYDGMISQSFFVPEKNIGVIIVTNSNSWLPGALKNKILEVLLSNNLNGKDWSTYYLGYKIKQDSIANTNISKIENEREKLGANPLPINDYTGVYKDNMYGTVTVSLKENQLYFSMDETSIFHAFLKHWNYTIFTFKFSDKLSSLPMGKLWFDLDKDGKIEKLHINVPNPDFDFTEFEFIKQ